MLMRKHTDTFTEDEILEISDHFYAGKSGGSVPFDRFIEAIDRVVQREGSPGEAELDDSGNPLKLGSCGNEFLFYKPHGNYTKDDLDITMTHYEPTTFVDKLAFNTAKIVRFFFDKATGWTYKDITQEMVLQRVIYLETIAAVPGMVAAVFRHFRSLRNFERDGGKSSNMYCIELSSFTHVSLKGQLQLLLDEAQNE